jgi:hypothetical protein
MITQIRNTKVLADAVKDSYTSHNKVLDISCSRQYWNGQNRHDRNEIANRRETRRNTGILIPSNNEWFWLLSGIHGGTYIASPIVGAIAPLRCWLLAWFQFDLEK